MGSGFGQGFSGFGGSGGFGGFEDIFSSFFGGGSSAFHAITDGSGDLKIGSILALGGAIAGIVFCFVSLKAKLPVKLISLIVSIVGGVYVWICYMNGGALAKGLFKASLKITGSKPGIGAGTSASLGFFAAGAGFGLAATAGLEGKSSFSFSVR